MNVMDDSWCSWFDTLQVADFFFFWMRKGKKKISKEHIFIHLEVSIQGKRILCWT